MKIILDLDTGVDDLLALSYVLAHPDADLVGVIGTYGNVTADQAVQNNLDLLALYGAEDVPVVRGATHPSTEDGYEPDPTWHGENGTGNVPIPAHATAQPADITPTQLIADAVDQYGDDLRVVVTGPSTTIAQVLAEKPELAEKLHVVMMGGSLTQPGNMNDFAECNVMTDADATDELFKSGADVTVVGLDVTMQELLTKEDTAKFRDTGTAAGAFVADATDYYIDVSEREDPAFQGGCNLHDPLAAAVAIDPTLVTCFPICLQVDREGEARGRLIGDPNRLKEQPKRTRVALAVDASRAKPEFMERVTQIVSEH